MDRISDSGSDGWGSIPHGGTNNKNNVLKIRTLFLLLQDRMQHCKPIKFHFLFLYYTSMNKFPLEKPEKMTNNLLRK